MGAHGSVDKGSMKKKDQCHSHPCDLENEHRTVNISYLYSEMDVHNNEIGLVKFDPFNDEKGFDIVVGNAKFDVFEPSLYATGSDLTEKGKHDGCPGRKASNQSLICFGLCSDTVLIPRSQEKRKEMCERQVGVDLHRTLNHVRDRRNFTQAYTKVGVTIEHECILIGSGKKKSLVLVDGKRDFARIGINPYDPMPFFGKILDSIQ